MGCPFIVAAQSRTKKQPPAAAKTPTQPNAEFDNAVKAGEEARIANRLDDAIQSYKNAVRIQPKWADGWWYLGALFYQKDFYPKHEMPSAKLVVLEPNRGPAWAMLGLCQFQMREYELAGKSLERGYALGLNGK
jgi:tetratricopeptide (TPR) repeat protein